MTGRKLPMVCHRLGSKMTAQSCSCWPMLISAITFSLLSSCFIAIGVEATANSYVVANVNSNNNNHHQASVTSPPFVSAAAEAAAAAALGGIDVGRSLVTALLGSPATSTPAPKVHQTVVKMNSATERAVSMQQKQKQAPQQVVTTVTIAAQTTTKPSVVVVKATSTPPPLALAISHKHSGKVINVSDTLHKFDLYLDPVCDQINKLTSKQLSKVYVQLKQFSQKNNDALAKCFNGHGFHLDLLAAGQQQTRPNRDPLAILCSARSLANEPYKQFSACAAKSWSKTTDGEIDHALKDRLRGNKATASSKTSSQQLTSAEMSLIDDIVAQLQEGQIAEITTELGGEHSSVSSATASKIAGAKEDKAANKMITIQQVAGGASHQSSGKSETNVSSSTSSGKQFRLESTPPSGAVVLSKSSENLSVNEHSAQKAASTTTNTTSITSSTTSFQAPSANLEKDFRANVAGGQSANNVKLTLITTIAPSFTQHNGQMTETGDNKVQLSKISVNNKQQTTSAPSTTSVVFIEDAKKSAQTTQAGSSIKVVEEHKSQSVNLLNAGGNSIKLTADGTSTQMLTTNQQNSLANQRAQALVNNLKPSPPPPTSLPPPPAVIPAPPTQQTFAVNQKIGSGSPLPPVLVPAQVPLPAAVPVANQIPPPLPTISPLANMMLNSMSLTTIGPLAKAAASASADPTNNLNPPTPQPAPAASNFNGLDTSASAAGSASGKQNAPFNAAQPAASAASAASAVSSTGPAPLPVARVNPPPVAHPPQGPPIALAAASSDAGAATFQPLPLAGAGGSILAPPSPLIAPLPPPPPPPPPSPLPPAPVATVGSGAAVVATGSGNKDSSDLLHPDHQLATPTSLAAATSTANAAVAARTTSASAKNSAGGIAIAQAPAGPAGVKMEHTMLKNVDKALDLLNAAAATTTTTAKPEKPNRLLEMIGSAVVKETLDNAASASSDKVAAIVIPVTTTRAPISVIIIDESDQENETKQKKSQATSEKSSINVVSEKSHHDDDESFELTSADDVIVVGEHVEGDDLVHDHEDHSQHHDHDERKSSVSFTSSSHHNEHDESDNKAKIEHTNQSSEIKKTTTITTSTKTKSFVEAHEEDHSDHEHLIEGLKDGDVIHVEAAELKGHEGGN